jgi:hypothetical protein
VNEIGNALAMLVEDPVSNNILRSALEVCNKRNITSKTSISIYSLRILLLFQKMQRRLHRIMTHCGCCEHVVEDVYCTMATPVGLNYGARSSYADEMSSGGAGHDDSPDLGLNTTMDILSQLEDAPDTTQPS